VPHIKIVKKISINPPTPGLDIGAGFASTLQLLSSLGLECFSVVIEGRSHFRQQKLD